MEKMLSKTAKKAEKKNNYKPPTKFFDGSKKLSADLKTLAEACNKVIDIYTNRVDKNGDKNKNIANEKVILDVLRNILDTQIHLINGIDAIIEYIDSTAEAMEAYNMTDEADTKDE